MLGKISLVPTENCALSVSLLATARGSGKSPKFNPKSNMCTVYLVRIRRTRTYSPAGVSWPSKKLDAVAVEHQKSRSAPSRTSSRASSACPPPPTGNKPTMEGYYWLQFGILAIACAGLEMQKAGNKERVAMPDTFISFRNLYLFVYSLMMAGDWLQGPYIYQLYRSYGIDKEGTRLLSSALSKRKCPHLKVVVLDKFEIFDRMKGDIVEDLERFPGFLRFDTFATDPDPSASGIRDIQVRVNGKFSLEAIGAEEWSIPLLLSEGINTIEVIATDYADNISKPVIWEIDYQAPDVPNDHFGNSEQMNRDVVIADGITNQILLSQDVKNQNDLYIEINGITLGQESYDLDSLSNKKITINKTPAKGSEINIFYNDWLSELVDTEKATKETNEPDHAGNEGGASVWWTFTAPYDGILCVKTTNTKIDTIMGLYQGERLGNLLMLQSNDDDQSLVNLEENPGLSRIDQALAKGSTVRIAVDGFGGLKGGLGISSVFTQQEVYKLTINEGQNGSLKLPSLPFKDVSGNNFGLYARNTEIEVIAIADEGYNFSGWSGSVNSLDNPIKIVVTKDTDLKANFSSRSLSDDFESGSLARLPWLTDISSGWIVQNELSLDGDFALKSGEIGDGQESEITVSVDSNNGKGSFYVKLDSEINWDKLLFLIDGRVVETWSGNVEWNKYEFNLSQGSHELKWIYKKDFANSVGADSAWIDNIKLPLSLKASVGLVSSESGHKVRVWGVSGHRYNIQVSNDLITWKPFDSVIIGAGGITEGKAVINTKEGAAYFRAVAP